MGRKGSRLTEQRLVPFQAGRDVAYPYDRPRALHRVPLCGLILVYTDLDTTGHGRPKAKLSPTTHCVYTRFYHIPKLAVLFYADRRCRLNLPSPRDIDWRIVSKREVEVCRRSLPSQLPVGA